MPTSEHGILGHPGCHDNFDAALPMWLLRFEAPRGRPGDLVLLHAGTDLIVITSARRAT